jgi:hypothetical protein
LLCQKDQGLIDQGSMLAVWLENVTALFTRRFAVRWIQPNGNLTAHSAVDVVAHIHLLWQTWQHCEYFTLLLEILWFWVWPTGRVLGHKEGKVRERSQVLPGKSCATKCVQFGSANIVHLICQYRNIFLFCNK